MVRKIITLSYVLSLLVTTHATLPKFKSFQDIPPEDIGLYHTDAFERLGAKLLSHDKPENLSDVIEHIIEIMSSYCDGHDQECIKSAEESMHYEYPSQNTRVEDVYLEDFDPLAKKYLESFQTTILSGNLNKENGDVELISALSFIQDELREEINMKEDDKNKALAAGSVAIESAKLWTNVFSDQTHPLHTIKELPASASDAENLSNRRNLQEVDVIINLQAIPPESIPVIIFVDFMALVVFLFFPFPAIVASFLAYMDIVENTPN